MKSAWITLVALLVAGLPGSGSGQQAGGGGPAAKEGPPLYREPGAVAVLAVATDRWEAVPTHPEDLLGDFHFIPESSAAEARGQFFTVLESDGGAGTMDAHGQVVAVPWTYGCGCAEVGWGEYPWVTPGDTVAFLLTPTRARVAWDGPPVYDVLGWHQPYPAGEMIPYWRKTPKLNPDWLTVKEYFELLRVLPRATVFHLTPAAAFDGVHAWLDAHPDRKGAFPVEAILHDFQVATEGLTRQPSGR